MDEFTLNNILKEISEKYLSLTVDGGIYESFLRNVEGCKSPKSIIRILLEIPGYQPQICSLLLQNLQEVSYSVSDRSQWSTLILSQLKWLDNIVDKNGLAENITECLQTCEYETKVDIINLLPEILGDIYYSSLVEELLNLLDLEESLMPHILDSLSNMVIVEDQIKVVYLKLLEKLDSVKPSTLPIVLKFLTLSKDLDILTHLVKQLRKMDLHSLILDGFSNGEVLFADSLKSGLRLNHEFVKIYIESLSDPRCFIQNTVDVYICLLIYVFAPNYKSKIEALLKKLALNERIKRKTIKNTIKYHQESISEHLNEILVIARCLINNSSQQLVSYGQLIYVELFVSIQDSFCRHAILSSIISHLSTSVNEYIGSALDILYTLVRDYINMTQSYSNYVQSTVDYFDNEGFSFDLIKKIYKILVLLGYPQDGDVNLQVSRDISILISKQLNHPDPRYNCIGVIGVATLLDRVGLYSIGSIDRKYLLDVIERAMNIKSARALSLLYDELARSIRAYNNLDADILKLIYNIVRDKFSSFMITKADVKEWSSSEALWMDRNHEPDESMALNIYGMNTSLKAGEKERVSYMLPSFRLLQITMTSLHGNLDEMDVVLGCPVYMFEPITDETYENMTGRQKEDHLHMLIQCANWFIELLNAWTRGNITESPFLEKLLIRTNDLYEMLTLIEKYFIIMKGKKEWVHMPILSSLSKMKERLRDMDMNVLKLLAIKPTDGLSMGSFYMIISDFKIKLSFTLGTLQKKLLCDNTINEGILKVTPRLLKILYAYLSDTAHRNKDFLSNLCLTTIVEVFFQLLNVNDKILEEHQLGLDAILSNIKPLMNGDPFSSFYNVLYEFLDTTQEFESAVQLVNLLHTLTIKYPERLPQTATKQQFADRLLRCLEKDWDLDNKKTRKLTEIPIQEGIHVIIDRAITHTNDPIGFLYYFATQILPMFPEQTPIATLSESTIHQFLKTCMYAATKIFEGLSLTSEEDAFVEVKGLLEIENSLIRVVWDSNDKKLFPDVLSNSKAFINIFAKKCDWLSSNLLQHKEIVLDILKSYQIYVKVVRDIMTLLKHTQDKQLSRSIAPLKKLMESVIFKVEQIMKENSMISSFLIGTPKSSEDQRDIIERATRPTKRKREKKEPSRRRVKSKKKMEVEEEIEEEEEIEPMPSEDIFEELDSIEDVIGVYDNII